MPVHTPHGSSMPRSIEEHTPNAGQCQSPCSEDSVVRLQRAAVVSVQPWRHREVLPLLRRAAQVAPRTCGIAHSPRRATPPPVAQAPRRHSAPVAIARGAAAPKDSAAAKEDAVSSGVTAKSGVGRASGGPRLVARARHCRRLERRGRQERCMSEAVSAEPLWPQAYDFIGLGITHTT